MKASGRTSAALSGLAMASMTLACTLSPDQPPLPSSPSSARVAATAAPVPARPPLGTHVRVQLEKISTRSLKHVEKCRGAAVGSTFLPCNLQHSPRLRTYLGQVERLTKLVRDNLEAYPLETKLDPVQGSFMQVNLQAVGHADALRFEHPPPALALEYEGLTRLLNVKREERISGNRMLALTRGLHLANFLGPHLDKALEAVRAIVRKSITVDAFVDPTNVGSDYRGADVAVVVQFRLPNHEIALMTCAKIDDAAIVAERCEVVAI